MRLGAWLAVLLWAVSAMGFTPPPLERHVTDVTGTLSPAEVQSLSEHLGRIRARTGKAIVVLLANLADGETLEDAAFETFNTWKVGEKGRDDGVLLFIAPNQRRIRIETGKGVGDALPDLRANDIINQDLKPSLKAGRYAQGILLGVNAIARALAPELAEDAGLSEPPPPVRTVPSQPPSQGSPWGVCCLFTLVAAVLLFSALRRVGRRGAFWGGFIGGGGGGWGGGGWGDSGGGGGGDSGGGYSGGGGESGGGGSSDSY